MTAIEVLEQLLARGVRLDVEDGKLRPRGPEGVDLSDLRAALKPVRADLVDLVLGWRCWECGEAKVVMFALAPATKGGQEPYVCGDCVRGPR